MTALIIFFILVILALGIFSLFLVKRNDYYKVALGNMSAMVIMQRMFELMASAIPAEKKIEELNNIIIEVFNPKSSTISLYDGIDYEIKATNVDKMYEDSIAAIAEEQDFKNNAVQNISKYLVAAGGRILGYKSAMERGIKSSMFSPVYYNGTYLGFWLLEDDAENAYDSISKEELAKLKDNMGVFIENVTSQASIEKAYNIDKQTGFYNNLYLFSNARQKTSSVENSALTIILLTNLPLINDNYGREVGNRLLERAAKLLEETFSSDNIFIRYSGSRFCIVSPGVTSDNIHSTLERFISNVKMQEEMVGSNRVVIQPNVVIHTIKKQSNIEREISKMAQYVDEIKETNVIKII